MRSRVPIVVSLTASLLGACAKGAPPSDSETVDTGDPHALVLPEHDDCLPDGEVVSDEVCIAFLEADGRQPTRSEDRSGVALTEPDPRVDDPDLQWVNSQVRRCACSCCHQSTLGGCGTHKWDLDHGPVWIDSMSSWSARAFAGIRETENRFLPVDDLERVRVIIQAELDRRDAAED